MRDWPGQPPEHIVAPKALSLFIPMPCCSTYFASRRPGRDFGEQVTTPGVLTESHRKASMTLVIGGWWAEVVNSGDGSGGKWWSTSASGPGFPITALGHVTAHQMIRECSCSSSGHLRVMGEG